MVNDSKLQLMYLMILFGLCIAQLNISMTLLWLNQKHLRMQRNRLAIIMKKWEIRNKLLLAKTRTARRSCWAKKGRTNAGRENFITNKVPESEWKDKFWMSRKSFYELCDMLRPCLEKKRTRLRTRLSVEVQVCSFLYYISDKGLYRKTANAFGISRASISEIIRRVSYAVTNICRFKTNKFTYYWRFNSWLMDI